jgi:hypothetical protein
MSSSLVLTLLLATLAAGPDMRQLPKEAGASLDQAVAKAVATFNKKEQGLRDKPDIQSAGDPGDPSMLRATYRRAANAHTVRSIESGASPVAVVRVRAIEVEKRVTNVNGGDIRAAFAKAPWRDTPRGWVLDFRFRWTGKDWQQDGDPASFPTLGVVGD